MKPLLAGVRPAALCRARAAMQFVSPRPNRSRCDVPPWPRRQLHFFVGPLPAGGSWSQSVQFRIAAPLTRYAWALGTHREGLILDDDLTGRTPERWIAVG
jgi:hypothetical protein